MARRWDQTQPGDEPRRQFTDEFKAGAVRLVLDEGKTVGAVARDLDLTESALREWVEHARADRTKGTTGLTTAEREELARLRKENRELRMERDILKKAAAFFAKHQRNVRLDRTRRRPSFPIATLCQVPAGLAERLLRVASAAGVGARADATAGCRCWCAPRSTRASSGTAARAFTRICSSSRSASVASGSSG